MKYVIHFPVVPVRINQRFGPSPDPELQKTYEGIGLDGHNGWDFWAPDSWVVRAAHDGIVTFAGEDGSGGLGVVIRTTEPREYNDGQAFYKSIYWHLKPNCIYVRPGQTVETGDIIALADNTGLSTGSHLHFGIKPMTQGENDWTWLNIEQKNGYLGAIDPAPYWSGKTAEEVQSVMQRIAAGVSTVARLVQALAASLRGSSL